MKFRISSDAIVLSDKLTYVLLGIVLFTILAGSVKIIFF